MNRMVACLVGVAAGCLVAGCHRTGESSAAGSALGDRTVFTDSTLHAERCAPPKVGEDWRRTCTPIDQSVIPRKTPPRS